MRKLLLTFAVAVCAGTLGAQPRKTDVVKAWEGTIDMPTYLLDAPEEAPVFERDTPHAIGNAFRDNKPFLRGCGGIKPAPAQFHAWHESRGKQRY